MITVSVLFYQPSQRIRSSIEIIESIELLLVTDIGNWASMTAKRELVVKHPWLETGCTLGEGACITCYMSSLIHT